MKNGLRARFHQLIDLCPQVFQLWARFNANAKEPLQD